MAIEVQDFFVKKNFFCVAATGNMIAMEDTGLGRILADFARKANAGTRRERVGVSRSYHKTVADLRLPKGAENQIPMAKILFSAFRILCYPVMLSHFSPAPVKTDRAVRIQ